MRKFGKYIAFNVLWLCEVWGKPSQFLIFSLMFPSTKLIFSLLLPPKSCKTAVVGSCYFFDLVFLPRFGFSGSTWGLLNLSKTACS